jgi:hypothetical protein
MFTETVAAGHSIIWYGRRYLAGEMIILPLSYAIRLQGIGFLVGPPQQAAQQQDAQPLGMP